MYIYIYMRVYILYTYITNNDNNNNNTNDHTTTTTTTNTTNNNDNNNDNTNNDDDDDDNNDNNDINIIGGLPMGTESHLAHPRPGDQRGLHDRHEGRFSIQHADSVYAHAQHMHDAY